MNYDVIVIGESLSAVCAGAVLSRKRFRVLNISGPWSSSAPLRPLPDAGGPFLPVLEKLRIAEELSSSKAENIISQVIDGEHRLDWYNARVQLFKELKREFGDSAEAARDFIGRSLETGNEVVSKLASMPLLFYDGLFSGRKQKSVIKEHFPAADLFPMVKRGEIKEKWERAFFAQSYFSSYYPVILPQLFSSAYFSLSTSGLSSDNFSSTRVAQILRNQIAMGQGRVIDNMRIQKLAFDGKKLAGVIWDESGHVFSSELVVWCESPKALVDALPDTFKKKSWITELSELRPLGYWVSYRIRIREELLPVGLAERMVFFGDSDTHPAILLNEKSAGSEAIFNLNIFVEDKGGENKEEQWKRIYRDLEKLLGRVKKLMPFANISDPIGEKEEIMRSLFPIYGAPDDSLWGLTSYNPVTPINNLFLGGPWIWPALGPAGELLLGHQLAMLCAQKLVD